MISRRSGRSVDTRDSSSCRLASRDDLQRSTAARTADGRLLGASRRSRKGLSWRGVPARTPPWRPCSATLAIVFHPPPLHARPSASTVGCGAAACAARARAAANPCVDYDNHCSSWGCAADGRCAQASADNIRGHEREDGGTHTPVRRKRSGAVEAAILRVPPQPLLVLSMRRARWKQGGGG